MSIDISHRISVLRSDAGRFPRIVFDKISQIEILGPEKESSRTLLKTGILLYIKMSTKPEELRARASGGHWHRLLCRQYETTAAPKHVLEAQVATVCGCAKRARAYRNEVGLKIQTCTRGCSIILPI